MTIRQICQWIISIWKFRRKNSSTATTECLEKDTTEIFGINRVLSEREALPLLDATVPSTLIPGSFFAYCKLGNSFDEIVAGVSEQAADRQVGEILRNERYLLRSEKKRPWSFKTRRPFRGRTDKITPTFREKLELAEKTVDEIGPAGRYTEFLLLKLPKKTSCCGFLVFQHLSLNPFFLFIKNTKFLFLRFNYE